MWFMTTEVCQWSTDLVESANRRDDDNFQHKVGYVSPLRTLTNGRVWGDC